MGFSWEMVHVSLAVVTCEELASERAGASGTSNLRKRLSRGREEWRRLTRRSGQRSLRSEGRLLRESVSGCHDDDKRTLVVEGLDSD